MSVLAAVVVVVLLVLRPGAALWLTWDVLIPAVPLLLLVAPGVWRNLCPISVVHQLPATLGARPARRLARPAQAWAPAVAAALLFLIVPLRLVLFNDSGPALALFVVSVLVVALVGGLLYAGKAGWCATFCPVLPVERLYGQAPPVQADHAHCATCTGCIAGCYDLGAGRSMAHAVGNRRGEPLYRSPMGIFAAAFPGFVLGYFTAPEAPTVLQAYGWILSVAAGGAVLLMAFQALVRIGTLSMTRIAAALAIGLYYWFTVPAVAAAAHEMLAIPAAPAAGIIAARTFFVLVAAGWLAWTLGPGRRGPLPRSAPTR
ncbi:MAG: hypothetical protein WEB88_10620 [Gemmatimonadota bacterium]